MTNYSAEPTIPAEIAAKAITAASLALSDWLDEQELTDRFPAHLIGCTPSMVSQVATSAALATVYADIQAEAQEAAALTAVLELHEPVQLYELDGRNGTWVYGDDDERVEFGKLCRECSEDDDADDYQQGSYVEWPCPTVAAIETARGVTA